MHISRREFLDNFLGFMGESGDTEAYALATQELNRAIGRIAAKHPWSVFRYAQQHRLTLVANQSRYALPDWAKDIGPDDRAVRSLTQLGQPLRRFRDGLMADAYPEIGTSAEVAGTPIAFEVAGVTGVTTQPSSAGEAVEAVSSSATDTDVEVVVAGLDANGNYARAQATLNGTTAVAVGTFSYIDDFGKSYDAASTPATALTSSRGSVTLRTVAGPTTLQTLLSQESAQQHLVLTLYPKPSAADTLLLPLQRRPKRLLYDADVLPDGWEPALFEDMVVQWQVNRGQLSPVTASQSPRPALRDLVEQDVLARGASRTQPYGGA